uniref:Uncharacterized protein n=1 Tax=Trichobilharzia regenti TaxID=157069 RepID=A0AA85IQV2_TRIRE|nr:unnamed protein product [Trichobilharzia regenti]CAH8854848.1 unnamed protein product [Trichobilharzia regenti]
MSYSNKHEVIFLDKKDARSTLRLEDYYDIDRKFSKPGFRTESGQFNWHCSCVSSYISGPCGYFFRNFMQNIDKFMKNEDAFEKQQNRNLFVKLHSELMGCLKSHSVYYKSFMDEYASPLDSIIKDVE